MQMFVKFFYFWNWNVPFLISADSCSLISHQVEEWIAPSWDNTSEKAWTQEHLVKHSEYITFFSPLFVLAIKF